MAYATIDSYTDSTVFVTIGGLEYPARNYDCFRLYLNSTHMGWKDPTSGSSAHGDSFEFDITQSVDGRITQAGYHIVHVYGVYRGREYPIPIRGNDGIRIKNGGGDKPLVHPLTYIKLIDIISAEDGYVKVQIQTDGYGDVDLISVTKGWDLMGRYKNKKYEYIKGDNIRPDQVSDGKFYGTATYEFNKTDLSYFPSVPVGTCYIASGNSGITYSEYSIYSKPFLCMSTYDQWISYDRTYATTLKFSGGQMFAGVDYLSSVKRDWTRLVNMSFYLEATTYGDIKYSTYSGYIPQYGDIITADMYNALLSSVYNCCERVGVYTGYLPSRVSSNQIISKNFIQDIGKTIDECLVKQKRTANEIAVSN